MTDLSALAAALRRIADAEELDGLGGRHYTRDGWARSNRALADVLDAVTMIHRPNQLGSRTTCIWCWPADAHWPCTEMLEVQEAVEPLVD